MRGPAAVVLALAAMLVAVPSAVAGWWRPPQRLTWYWQLQGAVKNDKAVDAYDIDGFENDAGEVALLHGQGKRVICYIDVGTSENFRPDNRSFPASVKGRSNGWPGERWLDVRRLGVLEPIISARFEMCAQRALTRSSPTTWKRTPTPAAFR